MAPGSDYPPLILSEFLANPSGGLTTEWVEIKNRSNTFESLTDWRIASGSDRHSITHMADSLSPSGYLVVARDTVSFKSFYSNFRGNLRQPPSGWPTLNNTSDTIRLIDSYGIEADQFAYRSSYDSNYTWCRGETVGTATRWGRSTDAGGSPGEANKVLFAPDESGLAVTIDPQVFSPDGDGIDDSVSLKF